MLWSICRWDACFAGGTASFASGTEVLPVGLKFCRWDSSFAGGTSILPVEPSILPMGPHVCQWDLKFASGALNLAGGPLVGASLNLITFPIDL